MKAIKENKVYTFATAAEEKEYKAKGFDIYDDNGKLKERAENKAVSMAEYEALKKENARLKRENAKLKNAGEETPESKKE